MCPIEFAVEHEVVESIGLLKRDTRNFFYFWSRFQKTVGAKIFDHLPLISS